MTLQTLMRRLGVVAALAGSVLAPTAAWAGGFELPDQGTQALGRGAAFTAKADDGTAIYYNSAGLARQRGTRLYIGGNLLLHKFKFTRTGKFPDDPNDPATPWGGELFPTVQNSAGPFLLPMVAVSSDFGYFDRLTLALGAFGPSSVGNRTFPLGLGGQPAPSRYDYVQSRSTIIFPTLAAAYRVTPWLDIGAGAHLVRARIDQTTISYADASAGLCKNPEYQPCDSRNTLDVEGTAFTGSIGVLARVSPEVALGLQFRGPVSITANGTVVPQPPKAAPVPLKQSPASLTLDLPWVIRLGARWIKPIRGYEVWDLEADITYEAWGSAQAGGPSVFITDLGPYKNLRTTVTHGYHDLMSFRVGGAYNFWELDGVLSVRAGGFFDQSAADSAYTRLDFDTLSKLGMTLGLGYRRGAFTMDVAYAAVAGVARTVTDGRIRPINGAKGGLPVDANDQPLPAVNNGQYKSFTHVFSLGLGVTFDLLFGEMRKPKYGDPRYEEVDVSRPKEEKRQEEKADEKEKEKEKEKDNEADKEKDKEREREREQEKEKEKEKEKDKKPSGDPTQGTCKWGEC